MRDFRRLPFIIWSGTVVLAAACGRESASTCRNTILSTVTSPGAELEAVIFDRDCGATTRSSIEVSVLPPGAPLRASESGNLFIAETDRNVVSPGAPSVRVEWVGRNRLRVIHDFRLRIVKAVRSIAAVRVEYVPSSSSGADTVVVKSGNLSLRGLLWTPAGTGPFPGVLFNHGSYSVGDTLTSQDLGALGPVFARHGYVFLFLCRRGIGLSKDQGPADGDLMADALAARGTRGLNDIQLRLLEGEELNEAAAGLAFLRTLREVDTHRIAVAGHSFGGSLTLFLAARDTTLRAVVIFSGAAHSWSLSSELRRRLREAVHQTPPVFFIHAANDYSTESGQALAAEMQRLGRPHRLKIYPAFGLTPHEGHNFLFHDTGMWEADVFGFLDSIR
jgi:dienelactone hydrolase